MGRQPAGLGWVGVWETELQTRWQRRGNHSWWCVPSILMVSRLGRKRKPSRWATTRGQRKPLMDKVHATHGRMAQRDRSRKRGDGVHMKTIWFLISLSSSVLSTLGLSNHYASNPITYYLFSIESLLHCWCFQFMVLLWKFSFAWTPKLIHFQPLFHLIVCCCEWTRRAAFENILGVWATLIENKMFDFYMWA